MARTQVTPKQISQRKSDGNCQVEHAQDSAPSIFGIEIGNKCGRNRDERSLPNPDQSVSNEQLGVIVGDRGEKGERAPKEGAQSDDALARVPVGQRTDKRRRNHVKDQKGTRESTELGLRQVELGLN